MTDHDAQVEYYVTLGKAMQRITIERCAKIAEDYDSIALSQIKVTSEEIAAAIRALKDKL